MITHFIIPGTPVPWARARTNGKRFFTDPKVRAYKDAIALHAKAAGCKPRKGPCTLIITAFLPIPASWSKKKQEAALNHSSKPDWDNLGKIVSDALNEIAYEDDSQVYWASVKKVYAKNPRLEVTVGYADSL